MKENQGWHTKSVKTLDNFLVVEQGPICDELRDVEYRYLDSMGDTMCIYAYYGPIYITKEQAMAFFDLVPREI